jgi:hypothetical protein
MTFFAPSMFGDEQCVKENAWVAIVDGINLSAEENGEL